MRLIDADALRETMYHEAFETDTDMQKWDGGCWIRYKMFENALENAPTIDAEPREIGHWLRYEFGDYHWHKCSVCGKADKYIETIGNGDLQAIRHFCPICGARMEGEEE